jgi:hypothetical protein
MDSLSEGPLHDVDAGGALRRDWYKRINPQLSDEDLQLLDDSELWERVRTSSGHVVLWHGPHPVERIVALRACWHLRDQSDRVYEVAISPSGAQWKSGQKRPAFHDSIPIAGPSAAIQAWDGLAKVADVPARAKRWEELRDQPGDWIRVLDGADIVALPVTAYDAALVDACEGGDWTEPLKILGKVTTDQPLGFALVTWRIRELHWTGTLEGRGELTEEGLPAEVRPPRRCSRPNGT